MRWIVTLSGNRQDVERLAAEFADLSPVEGSPRELRLEFDGPEGGAPEKDAANVARAVIEAQVRRINGFARLRWGRTFEGVQISNWRTVGPGGETGQVLFVGTAYEHMLPEDFADMVERLGHPRPELPAGLDTINGLDGEAVATLAATNPSVALVLRLVDEMLVGDEEIDWAAGYSAMEVVEHDVHERGLKGQELGWWTAAERGRFRATADSVEVLGTRARHGKPFGLTEARMTSKQASWLVRRVAAIWVTWLLENEPPARGRLPSG